MSNWQSIGRCDNGDPVTGCGTIALVTAFSGDFNGNDYNISNLRIIIANN